MNAFIITIHSEKAIVYKVFRKSPSQTSRKVCKNFFNMFSHFSKIEMDMPSDPTIALVRDFHGHSYTDEPPPHVPPQSQILKLSR